MIFKKDPNKLHIKVKKEKAIMKEEIELLELKQQKQAYKKLLNSGKFSKRTINFCISFTALFAIACLYVQYKTGYNPSSLLHSVSAVFGGELLLLLFKRICATDDNKFKVFINKFSKSPKQIINKNKVTTSSAIDKLDDLSVPTLNDDDCNNNLDGGVG